MWFCIDCQKKFNIPLNGIGSIKLCPFCKGERVADYSEFPMSAGGLIPQVGKDSFPKFDAEKLAAEMKRMDAALNSFGIKDEDYEEAGIENSDCSDCPCMDCDDIECENNPEFDSTIELSELSFNDLDNNELCLMELVPLTTKSLTVNVLKTQITKMNERFLHTFVDNCFMPNIT